MRSSTVIALALVAAAGPALSAPVATSNFARADTPSTSAPTDVSSEAISLGAVSTIASVAAPLVGGIIDYFKNKGNQKQRRDALELESLLARAEDESDAISLGAVSTIASFAAPLVGGIIDHFRNKGKREDIEQLFAREDFEQLFAREDFEDLLARAVEEQDSEAVRLGTVANVASIGSSILTAFQGLWQRDESLLSRSYSSYSDDVSGALFDGLRHHYAPGTFHIMRSDEGEDSEAIKLGTVANIAGIGSSLVSAFHSIFGREDVMDLMARASEDGEDVSAALSTLIRSGRFNPYVSHGPVRLPKFQVARADAPTEDSEAIRLGQVADIASIGSSVVSAWHSIFGRDLLSRSEEQEGQEGQDSEAIKLGTVANIAGIGSSVVSMFHNLFGRADTGVFAPLARAAVDSDDSAAIVLRPGMHPIRIPSSFAGLNLRIGRSEGAEAEAESAALFLKGLHGIGRLGPQHWGVKRDVLEFLARAETTEESDAIKLGTLGNIASIGGSVISALHNLFSGNSKREITSILARADEDSAAIKLSTLGNIASIGGSVISAIHNLFSSGSQQQKRDFLEILQRAAVEDAFVARSLNELD